MALLATVTVCKKATLRVNQCNDKQIRHKYANDVIAYYQINEK